MSDVVNLGMVGCGGIMGAHESGLRQLWEKDLRGFRVKATCDIDEGRANGLADKIAAWQGERPTVYTNLAQMLEKQKDLTAADICTAHREHHTTAQQVLDAGLHLTIEKPIGITVAAGWLIINAAKKNGRILQVAENYRRSTGERAVKWALDEGRIGDLRQIYWIDVNERLWNWGWRDQLDIAGGGWSMDGGVHFADLFRYHIGEVDTLYSISKAYHPFRYNKPDTMEEPVKATVEDTTMAVLTFENGVTGTWCSTLAAPGRPFGGRAIYGSKGCFTWGTGLKTRTEEVSVADLEAQHRAAIGEAAWDKFFPRGVTDPIATELHEFIETIRGNASLETDGYEGLKSEAICLAIYESELSGQAVKVADVYNGKLRTKQAEFDGPLGLK